MPFCLQSDSRTADTGYAILEAVATGENALLKPDSSSLVAQYGAQEDSDDSTHNESNGRKGGSSDPTAEAEKKVSEEESQYVHFCYL